MLGVFVDPRRPKFNVTAKGQTLEENQLSSLSWPYFALFSMVAASLVMLGVRFVHEPEARDLILVVGVWSAFNLCLTGIALGAVSEQRERRSVPRDPSNLTASLVFGTQTLPVVVEDMSFGGFRVRMQGPSYLAAGGTGVLRIETDDPERALETPFVNAGRRVKNEARGVGLKFYGLNGDRFRIIAKVIFSDVDPIYQKRAHKYAFIGVMVGRSISWRLRSARFAGASTFCSGEVRRRRCPPRAPRRARSLAPSPRSLRLPPTPFECRSWSLPFPLLCV